MFGPTSTGGNDPGDSLFQTDFWLNANGSVLIGCCLPGAVFTVSVNILALTKDSAEDDGKVISRA